jgi:LacI family transcriptional regulator
MNKKKITLKDIAEMAGVSIATVSRVINQNGRFSKETERRVKNIIKKFDYQPNLLARSLRTKKAQVIGIIVPDIINEFFARMTLEIQKRLFELNYMAIICNTNETTSVEEEHLSMLKGQRVSGVVFITGDLIKNQIQLDVPTIYIDRKPPNTRDSRNYVFIGSDNIQGGYLATQELINKGCQRIAFVRLGGDVSTHKDRFIGYKKALNECKMPTMDCLIRKIDNVSYKQGYKITKELFESDLLPDGIFYSTDILALGALKYLKEQGIKVPEDVRIVGFDDISLTQLSNPEITTIRQSVDYIADLTVNTLQKLIDGSSIDQKYYTVPVEIIRRKTT